MPERRDESVQTLINSENRQSQTDVTTSIDFGHQFNSPDHLQTTATQSQTDIRPALVDSSSQTPSREGHEAGNQTESYPGVDQITQTNIRIESTNSRESQTEFGIDFSRARKMVEETTSSRKKPDRRGLNLDLVPFNEYDRSEFVIVDWRDFESIMKERHKSKSIQVQTDDIVAVKSSTWFTQTETSREDAATSPIPRSPQIHVDKILGLFSQADQSDVCLCLLDLQCSLIYVHKLVK